jgi:nucleotide-binding universal stress UspA family protein
MFTNVMVGVDGRQGGRDAIQLAKQLVAPNGAITLVHFFGEGTGPRAQAARAVNHGRSRAMLAAESAAALLNARLLALGEGRVGRGLHRIAETKHADLIVVGSCRLGLVGRVLLGDDTRLVLNGAPCAVAIAPAAYEAPEHLTRIGVGVDGSAEATQALTIARSIARRNDTTVSALAVISLQSIPYNEPVPRDWSEIASELVDDERRRLSGLADVDGDVTIGDPSEELERYAEALDLLVIGSRSHGPVDRLLEGSTSNYLARRAGCPLLVMPRSAREIVGAERSSSAATAAMATPGPAR